MNVSVNGVCSQWTAEQNWPTLFLRRSQNPPAPTSLEPPERLARRDARTPPRRHASTPSWRRVEPLMDRWGFFSLFVSRGCFFFPSSNKIFARFYRCVPFLIWDVYWESKSLKEQLLPTKLQIIFVSKESKWLYCSALFRFQKAKKVRTHWFPLSFHLVAYSHV